MGITGLQGLLSKHPFTTGAYIESTEAVTAELRDRPGTISRQLLRRLVRGLGRPPQHHYDGPLLDPESSSVPAI
ncbi:hypothetical protein ACTOB_003633 [Actinoplanes oblitus]|uniref:Uncharacterized protein n=1 Tax=Actinoplanes oblitus TaxID=3040509 RepID=A0ABY8WR90_9ACTN|nr:hypothetical protein [Actinoplanes oblitus]WIM99962.1 hypothetical protein ACTOB_003633 [Actinoplanes oblitus]